MRIFAKPGEAAEWLEEPISFARRNDAVIIGRQGVPIAVLMAVREDFDRGSDKLSALMADGRPAYHRQTSSHDECYDANGLPK